jgi:hypothetical protein
VLLLIHGTFSSTEAPVSGLGRSFFEWAHSHYRRVLGFDHWALSKSPLDNANDLAQQLDDHGYKDLRVDILAHCSGGLVARALVELCDFKAVDRVVLVGTPNCGTALANTANWRTVADLLVNLLHLDPFKVFGRLSGFLARFAAVGLTDQDLRQVPGLWALSPNATGEESILGRLAARDEPPKGVTYSAVTTNYVPGREPNIVRLLREAKYLENDTVYGNSSDLLVNTAHAWAVDQSEAPGGFCGRLPADRVLIYNPNAEVRVSQDNDARAQEVNVMGVHHTNLFNFEETRRFLQAQLTRE